MSLGTDARMLRTARAAEAPLELPAPRQGRLPRLRARFGTVILIATEAAAVLILWELLTGVTELVNPVFLPPPSRVVVALVEFFASGFIWPHLQFSATNWSIGYVLASLFGVSLGVLMGTFEPVGRLVGPLAWTLYVTPHISIMPLLIIWLGFGAAPIIALVFVSALFPVLLTTSAGIRTVDPALIRAGQVFGASWVRIQLKIVLPATLPFIVTGMRLAIPTSLIGMIIGEILGIGRGIGAVLALGTATFRVDQSIAAVVIAVTSSLTLLRVFAIVERRIAPWLHAREMR